MKANKSLVWSFILLVAIASLYRIIPGRALGFAPQIAMALFGGSIVTDKKYAFLLPLLSMLLSDIIYELLFISGMAAYGGFYDGQLVNYILFAGITVIGFVINKNSWQSILAGSLLGVASYYIFSNFAVWIGGGLALNNLPYPKTWNGLIQCMVAGLPFLKGSLYATIFFNAIFFSGNYLITKAVKDKQVATA